MTHGLSHPGSCSRVWRWDSDGRTPLGGGQDGPRSSTSDADLDACDPHRLLRKPSSPLKLRCYSFLQVPTLTFRLLSKHGNGMLLFLGDKLIPPRWHSGLCTLWPSLPLLQPRFPPSSPHTLPSNHTGLGASMARRLPAFGAFSTAASLCKCPPPPNSPLRSQTHLSGLQGNLRGRPA